MSLNSKTLVQLVHTKGSKGIKKTMTYDYGVILWDTAMPAWHENTNFKNICQQYLTTFWKK